MVALTLLKSHQVYVEWSIEKFSDLTKDVDYFVESDPFSILDGKWCLRFYPHGRKKSNTAGYMDLKIRRLDSGEKVNVNFETGFKRNDGSRLDATFYPDSDDDNTDGWYDFRTSETVVEMEYYLVKNDTVTIFCLARVGDIIDVPPKALVDGKEILSESLKNMYYNGRFTDVTVSSKSRSDRKLHKSILGARSSTLASIFSSNEKTNHVELCDCDPNVFDDFLVFIYTGNSSVVSAERAMSLYNAAIKYYVEDLKMVCIRRMAEQPLHVNTFLDYFISAYVQGDSEKKDTATEFFIHNAREIISKSTWDTFAANHPWMSKDLLYKVVEKGESSHTEGK